MTTSHFPEIAFILIIAVIIGIPYIFYLYCYVPRRNQLVINKLKIKNDRLQKESVDGKIPRPSDYHYAITFDSGGFKINDLRSKSSEVISKAWTDVFRVTAFKRDLFAIDCICLRFDCINCKEIEVDEDMAGWNRFIEILPTQLPGCKPYSEWHSGVVFPAFLPNSTEIYFDENRTVNNQ